MNHWTAFCCLLYVWDPIFVNFYVRDCDISWKHILIRFFDLSLLVSTNRDIRSGWRLGFRHSPDIQQITLSSAKPLLSQIKFDYSHVWWNAVLCLSVCQSLHILSCERSCIALNINFYALYAAPSCVLSLSLASPNVLSVWKRRLKFKLYYVVGFCGSRNNDAVFRPPPLGTASHEKSLRRFWFLPVSKSLEKFFFRTNRWWRTSRKGKRRFTGSCNKPDRENKWDSGKRYRADEPVSVINCGGERRWQSGRERIESLRERMGEIKILMESWRKVAGFFYIWYGKKRKMVEQMEVCKTERVVVWVETVRGGE